MRNALLVCCCLFAPVGLAACGGDSTAVDKVPTAPPVAQPLPDANTLASQTATGTTADATSTATPSSQATTTTPATGGVTPVPSSGGAAAPVTPAATTPAATTPAPSSGGAAAPATGGVTPSANAGSTKQFCQDNPGAC